jgi:hypothetical protein
MESAKETLLESIVNIAFYLGALFLAAAIIREIDDFIARHKK